MIVLACVWGLTVFATSPGTQALLRELALTIRAEGREFEQRNRRRHGKRAQERDSMCVSLRTLLGLFALSLGAGLVYFFLEQDPCNLAPPTADTNTLSR